MRSCLPASPFLLVVAGVALALSACGGTAAPAATTAPAAPAKPPASAPAPASPTTATPVSAAPSSVPTSARPAATTGGAKTFQVPQKTYELKIAGLMPASHFTQKGLQRMADDIQKYSQGKITVKTFLGGTLFKEFEEIEGIRSGSVDIASHTFADWNSYVPASEIWDIPYLFPGGWDQEVRDLPQIRDIIEPEMEQKGGAKLLGFIAYGDTGAIGNNVHDITKPDDLKGLKMRGYSRRFAKWLESVGASPVVISSADVYTALQRGTIDGAISGTTTFTSRKWAEVTKHLTYAPHMTSMFFSNAMNLNKWNSLEPAAQTIVEAAALDAQNWTIAQAQQEVQAAVNDLKKRSNLKFIVLTPDQEKLFAATNKVALDGFVQDAGETGKKLVDLAQSGR